MVNEEDLEQLEKELKTLKKDHNLRVRKAELVTEIKKIKRAHSWNLLWHLWNGMKLVGRGLGKFFNGLFKVSAAAGKNYKTHQPRGKKQPKKDSIKYQPLSYSAFDDIK